MNFESAREKNIYASDREKAAYLERAILSLLKAEQISISEIRCLFSNIVAKLEDTPIANRDEKYQKPYV